ncbi:MAG: alpha/beta fold hydrolase [Candidatus Accumulibacter sp.]|jgi:predicted esterase YcpF (UPF0227 family)|nr:alpha/beta fold hydrolase [Accumulibacter sp.]
MKPAIVYLHGFSSSPKAWKASILADAMARHGLSARFFCPALSFAPTEALASAERALRECVDSGASPTLVGSSLGAFYATILAERYAVPAVLVNPVVTAKKPLESFIGVQNNLQTGEAFELTREHVAALEAMETAAITPERYLVLVETGDEVLDYREAVFRYAGARQYVFEGGDHSFTRFPEMLPVVFDFCGFSFQDARSV